MMPTAGPVPAPAVEECVGMGRTTRAPRSGATGVMRRVGPFHVVPLLVLVLLLVVTAAATVLTGVVVRNQEHKLLAERANEVNLVLQHVDQHYFDRPSGPRS